jgi:hypothetical protein
MVKQRNIFTGKIDILTDPSDERGAVAMALHQLGSEAGKIVKSQGQKARRPEPEAANQVNLF